MSSVFAHVAVGSACYLLSRQPLSSRVHWPTLIVCVGLAVVPDFDYFLLWFWQYRVDPRITHSLGFSMLLFLLGWFLLSRLSTPKGKRVAIVAVLLAAFSHLLLDSLVGVYQHPWLWPFSNAEYRLPTGILPSAGALDLGNYYMWRNLLFEAGVLLPLFSLLWFWRRPQGLNWSALLVLGVGFYFLLRSIALPR